MSNDLIVKAAWDAVFNRLPALPTQSGLCLAAVRVIVEKALGLNSHELYARWLVAGTSYRPGTEAERLAAARANPYASDFERSVKELGFAVPLSDVQPGDLLFNHNALRPYGHVAVALSPHAVLENINPAYRARSIHLGHHSLSITPLESQAWTLCARLPDPEA